jgi:MFS family permease
LLGAKRDCGAWIVSEPGDASALRPGFFAFGGGVASWFGGWGMQQVLFSWIVVGELNASSEWVGIAQMSTMLPALFLLLAGGAVADRIDPRTTLIALHALTVVPVSGLALASAFGVVSMPLVIVYGLTIGSIQAFAMPARDTLLSRVAGAEMMRAVTSMTAIQFGAQAIGTLVAGLARWTGSSVMLCAQAAVFAVGTLFSRALPAAAPTAQPRSESFGLAEIIEGLAEVARIPALRAAAAMVVAVGIFFVGPFMVVFPLLVRDYYMGGVDQLSIVLMLFPLGTIVGSLVLRARGLRRKGRAALIALCCGASMQATIGTGVPFWALVVLVLGWGLAASVFINCSRTIFQEAAPSEHRGRVLAVYQLGFMGGGPVGALLSGFLSNAFGLHATLLVASACMLTVVIGMTLFTNTRHLE